MCKTETSGTTNAFHSSNQALMDHCSGFEWCVPWGEKTQKTILFMWDPTIPAYVLF